MYLVQIDVVGLQATQGSLELSREPASRIASLVWVITHRQVRLGGEDDVVAPAFKRHEIDASGNHSRRDPR